jgi:hypothetical protein
VLIKQWANVVTKFSFYNLQFTDEGNESRKTRSMIFGLATSIDLLEFIARGSDDHVKCNGDSDITNKLNALNAS